MDDFTVHVPPSTLPDELRWSDGECVPPNHSFDAPPEREPYVVRCACGQILMEVTPTLDGGWDARIIDA